MLLKKLGIAAKKLLYFLKSIVIATQKLSLDWQFLDSINFIREKYFYLIIQ